MCPSTLELWNTVRYGGFCESQLCMAAGGRFWNGWPKASTSQKPFRRAESLTRATSPGQSPRCCRGSPKRTCTALHLEGAPIFLKQVLLNIEAATSAVPSHSDARSARRIREAWGCLLETSLKTQTLTSSTAKA